MEDIPTRRDGFVPTLWSELVLGETTETMWNRMMEEKGYDVAKLPIPPFRVRLKRILRQYRDRYRESLALKIAPWLEPEDR